jgi:ribonuclease BN (tRNA processing enzyme)
VIPFPAFHDVPCVGYFIKHPDCGSIMFLTDSCQSGYTFSGLNHILIECNYSDTKLIESINAGRVLPTQRNRLMVSHMELESCKQALKENDLSNVANIVLLHLSFNNSDEHLFVSEVQKITGKAVYAAKPGLSITLNNF